MHAERLALIAIALRASGGWPRAMALRLALRGLGLERVEDLCEEDRNAALAWSTPPPDERELLRRKRIGASLRERARLRREARASEVSPP